MSDMHTSVIQHDGLITFKNTQDCDAIAENAKRLSNEGLHGSSDFRHAASFPIVMVEQYLIDKGITFKEFMNNQVHIKTMLSDPALSHFRIWQGKV